jgi:hypothetical protein
MTAGLDWEEEEQTWSDPEDRSITKLVWRRVPPDGRRCRQTIRSKASPWLGNQCARPAIHGGTVCISHGGRLPTVKKAAQRRLALASPLAADRLIYMALVKPRMADSDRIRALLAILDRAGVEGKSTIEVEVKPWQEALSKLFVAAGAGEDTKELTDSVADDAEYDLEGESWEPSTSYTEEGD